MKIKRQNWIVKEDYILLRLNQPYWNAYAHFNWKEKGVEGIGISKEAILKSVKIGKKIRVSLGKYGEYEISGKKAYEIGENYRFIARDNTVLFVIPRTDFKKVGNINLKFSEREEYYRLMNKVYSGGNI